MATKRISHDAHDVQPGDVDHAADCDECGAPFFITAAGVAHHSGDGPDGIDYEADADHVAYALAGSDAEVTDAEGEV